MPFSNQGKQKLSPYFGSLALSTVSKPNSKNNYNKNQLADASRCCYFESWFFITISSIFQQPKACLMDENQHSLMI
jgi:hypothetical protein